jgi:hypothetical protein
MDHIKRHFNLKHDPDPVKFHCPYCPYKSKLKDNLKSHVIFRHVTNTSGNS